MPPAESLAVLLPLLKVEHDAEVLGAIGYALGQIGDPGPIEPLIRLKDHPAAEVRYGVVQGLLGHYDDRAVAILMELSADADVKVRNWATFGLGLVEEVDTPAIRAALWARVADENDEVRAEALDGLALRGDRGIVEPLVQEIAAVEDEMWPPLYRAAVEAGTRLGDPRLYETLVRLRTFATTSKIDEELEEAIKNCTPVSAAQ
jgi:HEAT repeat protein